MRAEMRADLIEAGVSELRIEAKVTAMMTEAEIAMMIEEEEIGLVDLQETSIGLLLGLDSVGASEAEASLEELVELQLQVCLSMKTKSRTLSLAELTNGQRLLRI